MLSVIYGPYDAVIGGHIIYLPEAGIFCGFQRTAWAVGLSFIIISCALGQGGKKTQNVTPRSAKLYLDTNDSN